MSHTRLETHAQSANGNRMLLLRQRPVSVKQLPARLGSKCERDFYRELEGCMNLERPSIVLDCSQVREMDTQTIHILLCCLEGAMKRNGDVRLAGVSAEALKSLELAGADRLFRIFDTCEQAVESYQRRSPSEPVMVEVDRRAVNAA